MIKGVIYAYLGPIWHHSESSYFPLSPNQFFGLEFFLNRFLQQDGSRVFQTPGFRPPSLVLILLILCVLLIILYSIMVLVVISILFGPFETPYHVDLKTAKISLTKMDETFSDFCWKLLPT